MKLMLLIIGIILFIFFSIVYLQNVFANPVRGCQYKETFYNEASDHDYYQEYHCKDKVKWVVITK